MHDRPDPFLKNPVSGRQMIFEPWRQDHWLSDSLVSEKKNLKSTSNFQPVGMVKMLNLRMEVMLLTALTVTGTNITSALILIVLLVIQ